MAANTNVGEDGDTIINACTYHRMEFDRVLIRTNERKLDAPFLLSTSDTTSSSSLGILSRLPEELILMILRELDILSYLRFRGVNNRARSIATASREYKTVVKHGLQGLKPLLKAELAHVCTIAHFYQTLVSNKCEFCGKFATFLYLITCQRCCFTCLQISVDLHVLPVPVPKAFAKAVKCSSKEIEKISGPKLRVVYGKYSLQPWPNVKRPRYLVQAKPVVEKLRSLGSSPRIPKSVLSHQPQSQSHDEIRHDFCYRYMAAAALPWYDLSNDRMEPGMNCKGCQFRVEEYERTNRRLDPPWGFNDRDRVYSREEFLCHFGSCTHAQKVWADTQEKRMAPESAFTLRGGIVLHYEPRHELH
ncbi:hypothetical protein FOQG_16075 [Fusarium oxysporum f. sp. raphani 54005]|uniref:F-box domain-containing protein n=4 Tax=Fusarium oxysporum TaxID=5507 RepID=N4TMZ1_FUSC1|nr:hypothetical protein FOC1_g10000562 [Fusarium oxysporum f. sp. cubense race 1]EWZ80419.1 hypothetical protein FOWG_15512 [Fusarium oxysporum f. sp. lycopersici MN25]EXA35319.1 hypothetical protein FOVG_13412 [Fusarium oxysporum f. sp. pisi HDV247]EXK79279.1 hypothetical protein FOQG_16075 [Fusarium oxysporum f. sp. raphani 54005]EXL42256.1 hypothetical protein FOCG_15604 [Fusarium oxysporum f. sp. radicis-lycopersici 26381]KAH7467877.1 hypothetical protein FOMA001_g15547 [Fusarium oxysporum